MDKPARVENNRKAYEILMGIMGEVPKRFPRKVRINREGISNSFEYISGRRAFEDFEISELEELSHEFTKELRV